MPLTVLSAAPAVLMDAQGQLTMGRFMGQTGDIDWARLAPPLARSGWWRHFHHKCWQYVALTTDDFFCAVAIVDVGWTSTAFAYVFDRQQAQVVAQFSQDGLPGFGATLAPRCGAGAVHRFHWGGHHIEISHLTMRACYQLQVRSKAFKMDAEFSDTGPLLLAVGPVAGGVVHATQKSSGLALRGELRIGAQRHSLNHGVASMDYSNGLLGRETAWRWASAHSLTMGFNLQAGYFGDQENALWLNGRIIPLGQAVFDFDPENAMAPWHIHTTDGLLDVEFLPQGLRRENKDLWVAASRYVQPIGLFNGWVRASPDAPPHIVQGLLGVTEDHQSRW